MPDFTLIRSNSYELAKQAEMVGFDQRQEPYNFMSNFNEEIMSDIDEEKTRVSNSPSLSESTSHGTEHQEELSSSPPHCPVQNPLYVETEGIYNQPAPPTVFMPMPMVPIDSQMGYFPYQPQPYSMTPFVPTGYMMPQQPSLPIATSQMCQNYFIRLFNELWGSHNHHWSMGETPERPSNCSRWTLHQFPSEVTHICQNCSFRQHSSLTKINFWYTFDWSSNNGTVLYKIYRKQCPNCHVPKQLFPELNEVDINKAFCELHEMVLKTVYGIRKPNRSIRSRNSSQSSNLSVPSYCSSHRFN